MRNKGNVALLQTAVKRMKKLWPQASLEIVTGNPVLFKIYVPDCDPVPFLSTNQLSRRWKLLSPFRWLVPRAILRLLFELRDEYHSLRFINRPSQSMPNVAESPACERETLNKDLFEGVDLFVISGAQFMLDSVRHLALAILDRLEFAIGLDIPTVMVGQGIGPIEDPDLAARAREILPQVDYVLVREKVYAPSLLRSLGVAQDRIFVTGDDAVEMAYEARSTKVGDDIGIGMRLASYTGVKDSHIDKIQPVLHEASLSHNAKLISIPISYSSYEWELDERVIQRLSVGRSIIRHGWHRFEEPLELIQLVGKCRLVVTGTFHPAVFALAQGIPAICLTSSEGYTNKFVGLADLFGDGCEVLHLDDPHIQSKLASAIGSTWNLADQLRPQLLEAARRQIEWGHEGYQHIYDMVTFKNRKTSLDSDSARIPCNEKFL